MTAAEREAYLLGVLPELLEDLCWPARWHIPTIYTRLDEWEARCADWGGCGEMLLSRYWMPTACVGSVCGRCRTVWVAAHVLRAKKRLKTILRHELLHLRHPRWSEEKVLEANGEVLEIAGR